MNILTCGGCHKDDDVDIDGFIQALGNDDSSTSGFLEETQGTIESMLPVHRLMDSAPYTLLEEMPAPRLYPLFTRTGTSAACVVSRRGEFRGLLSRVNLISAASHAWRPPRKPRASASRYEPLS